MLLSHNTNLTQGTTSPPPHILWWSDIVLVHCLQERMIESIAGRYSLGRIKCQEFIHEIQRDFRYVAMREWRRRQKIDRGREREKRENSMATTHKEIKLEQRIAGKVPNTISTNVNLST